MIAYADGDLIRAVGLTDASLTISRKLGDKQSTGWGLTWLGRMATTQGDFGQAARCFTEALALFRELGHRAGIVFTLEGVAGLAAAQGDALRAARLYGCVDALREEISWPRLAGDRVDPDLDVGAVRAQLDEATSAAAWAEGRAMSLEQAFVYALEEDRDA